MALLEADVFDDVSQGDEIAVDISSGIIKYGKKEVKAKPIPPFMEELINSGGLINYLKKKLEK